MFLVSILGFTLLGFVMTGAVVVGLPLARRPRFSDAVWSVGGWVPLFSLALVWAIALGTWLATGSWPERSGMVFPLGGGGDPVFVGNPPDGLWGILRFLAQLSLLTTIGMLLGLPVAHLLRPPTPQHEWLQSDSRRNAVAVFCMLAIVASYFTTPGRRALDWIID